MKLFLIFTLALASSIQSQTINTEAKINVDELRCLVCEKSLIELSKAIKNIDPSKRIDVGGYRLDKDGNYVHKSVSQAKSELIISEIIEEICGKMDDYVRATWKSSGKLTLLRLINDNGQMSADFSEVDVIQDDDLNKSLKYYCEGIMEEFDEAIIKHFQDETEDIGRKVCYEETKLCSGRSQKVEL